MLKRKIYLAVEFLIFKLISLFSKKVRGDIVIIRMDAIGDYILFRNFLAELKNSTKFAGKKITLIGNLAWKDIAETFDSDVVDKFIWFDRTQIWTNKKYRIKKLIHLVNTKYEYVIQPTYSRDFIGDSIFMRINSIHKIGSAGNTSNMSEAEKRVTDDYYTELLSASPEIMFEFERNKEFFETLLEQNLDCVPALKATKTRFHNRFHNYAVLFVGASMPSRCWNLTNFIRLAEWLHFHYHLDIVICGGKDNLVNFVGKNLNTFMHNIIGKTSLVELVDILSSAKLVVSNETSVPHLCAVLSIPVFVLYNGIHFGRFIPYPKKYARQYFPIYHPKIIRDLKKYKQKSNQYSYGYELDINEITLDMVKNTILEKLNR